MPKRLSVEELVISDSFIHYCLGSDSQDIQYWQQYLSDFPDQKNTVEEAKKNVLLLKTALGRLTLAQKEQWTLPAQKKPVLKKWMLAAASLALALSLYYGLRPSLQDTRIAEKNLPEPEATTAQTFSTQLGAKQTITLPDGTLVFLNAGSRLTLEQDFGRSNRHVFLTGEAGFDVRHNEHLPFTVSVEKYDVRVIGTFFNVRAYPGDKTTETSLLRGKVDILIKEGFATPFRMSLKPQQKFVMDSEQGNTRSTQRAEGSENKPHAVIESISYNRDSINIETAWMQNKLIIDDETFEMMKEKLERWFNIKIIFKDQAVTRYPFNATFKGESIEQVLQALQASYFFNYEIKNGEISISK